MPNSGAGTVQISALISRETWEEVREIARRDELKFADVIRRYVREGLRRDQERKSR